MNAVSLTTSASTALAGPKARVLVPLRPDVPSANDEAPGKRAQERCSGPRL